jgi:hypothetical protein
MSHRKPRTRRQRHARLATAVAASALAAGALASQAFASGATTPVTTPTPLDASANFTFTTLDNSKDLTFNQLLGINNSGVIAGYFGSGTTAAHPNKGYTILPPYAQNDYGTENYPGSTQTQVTGLNNTGLSVGFEVKRGETFGFYVSNHKFRRVDFPTKNIGKPQVQQLLGVNDLGIVVGFWVDKNNQDKSFTYSTITHKFSRVTIPGTSNVMATGINNLGDISGTEVVGTVTEGFLLPAHGQVITLNFPGASSTSVLGVNDGEEVVGTYTIGTGSSATTHGFIWTADFGFATVDDPNGVGTTTVNGLNDHGDLVGFYVDSHGNTNGLLATP